MKPAHTLTRTPVALGTALGLTLASCAMVVAAQAGDIVSRENQRAAGSLVVPTQVAMQMAGLGSQTEYTPNAQLLVRKGTVLWSRIGDEQQAQKDAQIADELSRLREAVERMQGQTHQQITQLQGKLADNEQTLQHVATQQARQERELRDQAAAAVASVAKMAEESMRSTRQMAATTSEQWTQTGAQLAQLEDRLQSAIADVQHKQVEASAQTQAYTDLKLAQNRLETQLAAVREAREAAAAAEQRAKTFAETRLTAAQTLQEARLAAVSSQMAANQHITENKLAATEDVQNARFAAVSQQVSANQQLTNMQLAELRKVSEENRALASAETANVAAALRVYADAQLAQAKSNTSVALADMARATRQSVSALDKRTSNRMGVLWKAASRQAEKLAEEKANAVAASLAALQQQTAAQKVEPAQIRAIAERTVADATPEFRALALQTLKDGQDYIRSVARSAVQDNDPGMTEALASAARDVITKDDKVVFAIRKAVADELHSLATGAADEQAADERTVLGPDHRQSSENGGTELDPNRLRIAQLLAPGGGPAVDAALTDAQLAAISPAAGQAGLGGQQSWSAQGTSLMRPRNRADWMDIRQYKVVVHQDNETLEQLMQGILARAEPFAGPWQVRWKISDENKDILNEKFSLDAEAPFEEFVSYLAQYIVNDRGVKLSVSLFDSERIIVISD